MVGGALDEPKNDGNVAAGFQDRRENRVVARDSDLGHKVAQEVSG